MDDDGKVSMGIEEWCADLSGKMDAIIWMCAALVAANAHAKDLALTVQQLAETAKIAANANSTAQQKAFAQGMGAVVERFQAALKTAEQAAQVRDLPPQGGH